MVSEAAPLPSTPPEAPSVDVVFSECRARLDAQIQLIDRLGEDARFVLTAASVLLAGFAVVPGIVTQPTSGQKWLLAISLIIYVWLVISAVQGFRLRAVVEIGNPEGLRDYLTEEEEFTKRKLIAAMAHAHEENQRRIDSKAKWIDLAHLALVVEVIWLIIAAFIRANV